MKLIISLMLMIAIFPVVNLSCRAFYIDNVSSGIIFIFYTFESILVTIITFFSGVFIKSKYKKMLQSLLVVIVSILLGLIYHLLLKDISIQFWIISDIILGLIIKKVYSTDNDKFSNGYIFIVTSLVYLICTFLGWQSELGSPKFINAVLYVIFCVIFAIITNRNNLKKIIYRRTQNLDSIPKDIFKYNSKLTILLCIIPIPFLMFSNRIGSAIYGLMISLFRAILYVCRLLSRLFAKDNVPIETVENEIPTYNPYYQDNYSMFWDIFTIVFIVFLAFLICRNYEDIIKKIKEILSNIKDRFNKYGIETTTVREIPYNEGYTDYIKDISNYYNRKSFKKDYKTYLKMPTSVDTIKFGFSTLIQGLNLLGYNIKPYDTITDISNKFEFEQFSKIYLSIRYNDTSPTVENRLLLDNLLKYIYKRI